MNYSPEIWRKHDTILVKLPYKDFDAGASEHFKEMVANLLNKFPCNFFILDFSYVILMDGDGLASIVHALNQCSQRNIKLVVSSLNDNIFSTFKTKGISSFIEVFSSVHSALDCATHYSTLYDKAQEKLQGIENVFGDFDEELINYS